MGPTDRWVVDIVAGEPVTLLRQYRSVGHITIPVAPYTDEIVRDYQLTRPDMTYIIGRDGSVKRGGQLRRS